MVVKVVDFVRGALAEGADNDLRLGETLFSSACRLGVSALAAVRSFALTMAWA